MLCSACEVSLVIQQHHVPCPHCLLMLCLSLYYRGQLCAIRGPDGWQKTHSWRPTGGLVVQVNAFTHFKSDWPIDSLTHPANTTFVDSSLRQLFLFAPLRTPYTFAHLVAVSVIFSTAHLGLWKEMKHNSNAIPMIFVSTAGQRLDVANCESAKLLSLLQRFEREDVCKYALMFLAPMLVWMRSCPFGVVSLQRFTGRTW